MKASTLTAFSSVERGPAIAGLMIAFFLLLFLIVPVGQVIFVAFQDPNTGSFTLINFADFFGNSLFVESFFNSFYVATMSVIVASIIAMPLPILRPV